MSITAQDLLGLAKSLDTAGGELSQRSGISRAYYSCYHASQEWLAGLPGVPSQGNGKAGGKHQTLINFLANPAPEVKCPEKRKLSKQLSTQLSLLRGRRVSADYFLGEAQPFQDWSKNSVETAELLLSKIQLDMHGASVPSMAPALPAMLNDSAAVGDAAVAAPDVAVAVVSGGRPVLTRVK